MALVALGSTLAAEGESGEAVDPSKAGYVPPSSLEFEYPPIWESIGCADSRKSRGTSFLHSICWKPTWIAIDSSPVAREFRLEIARLLCFQKMR